MIDLQEPRQLVAFADMGTLSHVAEEFHISTPSVTRSMQYLEETFGVPLFVRGKNRIALNETGILAVEYARRLLKEADQAIKQALCFEEINGFNFLLRSELGFWDTLCRTKMPASKFLTLRFLTSWCVPPPCPALQRTMGTCGADTPTASISR